jgi:hypothetical protein
MGKTPIGMEHLYVLKRCSKKLDMLFTIRSYKNLLEHITEEKYVFSANSDCATKVLLLRHDIDFDLNLAHKMAIIENSLGVNSVYLVMVGNPLYDITSKQSITLINEIRSLGHQIGLHYDPLISNYCNFEDQLLKLGKTLGSEIKFYSHHQPTIYGFNDKLNFKNSLDLNLHAKDFKYISDSCMQPRENFLSTFDRHSKIQLLVHPEFWMLDSVDLYDFGYKLKKFQDNKNDQEIQQMISTMIETLRNRVNLDAKNRRFE